MKKNILLLLAILICTEIHAQVPGYKGKKFMLGYTMQMAPNLHDWAISDGKLPFHLHAKHIFNAEYVVGRHTTAALEGGFMRYKRTLWRSGETGDMYLNGAFFGASINFFGNSLAPIGNYFSLNVQRMYFNANDERGITRAYNSTERNAITGKFNVMAMGIGIGTRRVFGDAVVADIGVGSGLSYSTFTEGNILKHEDTRTTVGQIILFRHILNYKIGISGLLF